MLCGYMRSIAISILFTASREPTTVRFVSSGLNLSQLVTFCWEWSKSCHRHAIAPAVMREESERVISLTYRNRMGPNMEPWATPSGSPASASKNYALVVRAHLTTKFVPGPNICSDYINIC